MADSSLPDATGEAVQGRDRAGLFDVASCLMCGDAEGIVAADGVGDFFFHADPGQFTYRRCANCGSLWLESRPEGDRLLQAYSGYYTHTAPAPQSERGGLRGRLRSAYVQARFAASAGVLDNAIALTTKLIGRDNTNIDKQFRFAPKAPAKILDYGCGSGEYLLRMQEFGHELYGVEYDPELLSELARRGIAIADAATITDAHWQGEFDHITLSHVLEHVPDPKALLARLAGWLKPGGTLYLELPNGDATGFAIFGRHWRGLEAPRHFALPTARALREALGAAGFAGWSQYINGMARDWVWAESLAACPADHRGKPEAAIKAAPAETLENAEFLTFLARKPAGH